MATWRHVTVATSGILALGITAAAQEPQREYFVYDPADQTIPATVLDNPNYYDADIASGPDGLWLAWLEFVPGEGDHIWLGQYADGKLASKRRVTAKAGSYARPTITADANGQLWLTYEAELQGQWDVLFVSFDPAASTFPSPTALSTGPGPDVRHRIAVDPVRGLWVVWQSGRNGQFDILARRIDAARLFEPMVVST